MSLLFKIVYAAHANGTHHKLALDALRHLENPNAEAWTRLYLKYAGVYMQGSKAPDTEFKDFKNHVLHVRDGYWGGAPEKAQNWYGHVVEALQAADWERAVYASGVLSHYVTDPIHPFHTAQTEAENNIHRAVEWSINRDYDRLRRDAESRHSGLTVTATGGPNWLKDLVCQGADTSNKSYEKLIAHYDIHRGVVTPVEGLDAISRAAVSELLMIAAKTVAIVLDRAITESGATAPEVSLTAETVLATLKVPLKFVTKKIEDAETRRQVEAMYGELMTTGRVDATLAEDDRTVRDLYAAEVLAPRAAALAAVRDARVATAPAQKAKLTNLHKVAAQKPAAMASDAASRPITAQTMPPQAAIIAGPAIFAGPAVIAEPAAANIAAAPAPKTLAPSSLSQLSQTPRVTLALKDQLEAAPSIGPKMAERFAAFGITTVGDFLSQDAGAMAELLDDRRFNAATLIDWQHQARLVMDVPGMTGTQAQLLTGAGLRSAHEIAAADPVDLSAALMAFATTTDGRRILRDGNPPDLEKIRMLIGIAARALAA